MLKNSRQICSELIERFGAGGVSDMSHIQLGELVKRSSELRNAAVVSIIMRAQQYWIEGDKKDDKNLTLAYLDAARNGTQARNPLRVSIDRYISNIMNLRR